MCNIAGYVGEKDAAPILIDLMRKQEGFEGGYYTGLATIHEGKVHYAKVLGDIDTLLKETNAASLPGKIGIIHSRSNSGGGVEWGHPFVGLKNGEPVMAYVANGARGNFDGSRFGDFVDALIDKGYDMNAYREDFKGKYVNDRLGRSVHMSDVMCQLIFSHLEEGESGIQAMETSFCEMPSEIVGLMLTLNDPDAIFWSRISKPMNVGFAPHGAYLGTTAVFPEDSKEPLLLPACSAGRVTKNSAEIVPYKKPPIHVVPIDSKFIARSYAEIEKMLKERPYQLRQLREATFKFVDAKTDEPYCVQEAHVTYEIVRSLREQGRLHTESVKAEGADGALNAMNFMLSIKD